MNKLIFKLGDLALKAPLKTRGQTENNFFHICLVYQNTLGASRR